MCPPPWILKDKEKTKENSIYMHRKRGGLICWPAVQWAKWIFLWLRFYSGQFWIQYFAYRKHFFKFKMARCAFLRQIEIFSRTYICENLPLYFSFFKDLWIVQVMIAWKKLGQRPVEILMDKDGRARLSHEKKICKLSLTNDIINICHWSSENR